MLLLSSPTVGLTFLILSYQSLPLLNARLKLLTINFSLHWVCELIFCSYFLKTPVLLLLFLSYLDNSPELDFWVWGEDGERGQISLFSYIDMQVIDSTRLFKLIFLHRSSMPSFLYVCLSVEVCLDTRYWSCCISLYQKHIV